MKIVKAILFLLLIGGASAGGCYLADEPYIEFDREVYEDLTVEYGDPIPVHTISALYKSQVFHREGIPLAVETSPTDFTGVGTHTVRYWAAYEGLSLEGSYQVTIVDTVPPELSVDPKALTWTCVDNCDGDLSDQVEVEDGYDRILFTVSDSSGNRAQETVFKDVTPPVITLGERLLDYSCRDETDGDLTDRVRYYEQGGRMYYEVSDNSGNGASVSREIGGEDRVVYLTFDDGPGSYTPKLLDILKKYDVKATFFVVGNSKYMDLLPRMREEGHTIGAHTYTHVYAKVYASEDAYFADLDRVEERIAEQIGERTNLVRFPGGSSNTVSRHYSKGIMTRLTRQMGERGYVYFDWNVTSGDAGGTTETATVISNVKNGILRNHVAVVLQHDVKGFSVNAVEAILKWGLERGYVFLPLTERSTAPHQRLGN